MMYKDRLKAHANVCKTWDLYREQSALATDHARFYGKKRWSTIDRDIVMVAYAAYLRALNAASKAIQ